MRQEDAHLSDENLMLYADGEIRGREEADVRAHLEACWSCRLRMREFDDAITEFARLRRENPHQPIPPADGPRALLKARLREMASANGTRVPQSFARRILMRGGVCAVAMLTLLAIIWLQASQSDRGAIPRPDLTPGMVRSVGSKDVCRARLSDNAEVVPAMQRQVFAEYGMPRAKAEAYEVDYLITPALGGSDDIRNLWPQPYSGSPWNAHVKDALEDRLWSLVCSGQIDLATAQHELAVNWIAAYKKYFHTDRPLAIHSRFQSPPYRIQ